MAEAAPPPHTIIKGGRILNPATHLDCVGDVVLRDGLVAAVGPGVGDALLASIPPGDSITVNVFNATGLLVCPGLIDMHVHAYTHATELGVDLDATCLAKGVTTAVDAGSAGASTLAGLRLLVAAKARTRLLAFVNLCLHGLASAGCSGGDNTGGELDSLNQLSVKACRQAVAANPGFAVGVKLRLSADIADGGRNEAEAYARAREAAAGVPLMVHHTFSTVPLDGDAGCPSAMKAGDILTHALHGYPSTIIDTDTSTVHRAVLDAAARGVVMDVGHGQGSFNWRTAELCGEAGFWPNVVSTDLHTGNSSGPAYDLVTVCTKLLHVGMGLEAVIRAVTATPAAVLGMSDTLGSLEVGREADVSVLSVEDVDVDLEDCQGFVRRVKRRMKAVAVWRAGVPADIVDGPWPNPDCVAQRDMAHLLVVKQEP